MTLVHSTATMAAGHMTWPWPMNGLLCQMSGGQIWGGWARNIYELPSSTATSQCCMCKYIMLYECIFTLYRSVCMSSSSRLLEGQWGGETECFSRFKPPLSLFLTLLPSPWDCSHRLWRRKPHTGAAARIEEEVAVEEEDDNAGSGCSQNTGQQPNWMWWSCQIT